MCSNKKSKKYQSSIISESIFFYISPRFQANRIWKFIWYARRELKIKRIYLKIWRKSFKGWNQFLVKCARTRWVFKIDFLENERSYKKWYYIFSIYFSMRNDPIPDCILPASPFIWLGSREVQCPFISNLDVPITFQIAQKFIDYWYRSLDSTDSWLLFQLQHKLQFPWKQIFMTLKIRKL